MGKQVEFIYNIQEENDFLDFVLSKKTIKLLLDRSIQPDLIMNREELKHMKVLRMIYFMDETLGIFPAVIMKRYLKEFDKTKGEYFDTDQIIFYLQNSSSAPIIEYSRAPLRENSEFVRCRIWADMRLVVDNKFINKPIEFVEWYDALSKWLRKNLKRDSEYPIYFSKSASSWFDEQGKINKNLIEI